jgi:hypothetical protein
MRPSSASPGRGAERHPIVWEVNLVRRETSVGSSGTFALSENMTAWSAYVVDSRDKWERIAAGVRDSIVLVCNAIL